jgi:hypothetical protein
LAPSSCDPASSLRLTGGAGVPVISQGSTVTQFNIQLSNSDLNRIKADSRLFKSISSSFIELARGAFVDTNGNSVASVISFEAIQATEYTKDSQAPTVGALMFILTFF